MKSLRSIISMTCYKRLGSPLLKYVSQRIMMMIHLENSKEDTARLGTLNI